MAAAEEHKSGGIGKDVAVYVCLLVLAGIQFVIAYQNISRVANVRTHAVRRNRRGWVGPFVLHALVGESRPHVVRRDFHRGRSPRSAIWMDRQLPADRRRAVVEVRWS